MREAAVTIGVNRVPTARASNHRPLTYSRLRDLEAPMVGACYLTEWTAGLGELYELGTEIEAYKTPEELAAKLEALKRDPARRRGLRKRGQRRALEDHGVARSLKRIVHQLIGTRAA
jgi:spore maturation protein CgeB